MSHDFFLNDLGNTTIVYGIPFNTLEIKNTSVKSKFKTVETITVYYDLYSIYKWIPECSGVNVVNVLNKFNSPWVTIDELHEVIDNIVRNITKTSADGPRTLVPFKPRINYNNDIYLYINRWITIVSFVDNSMIIERKLKKQWTTLIPGESNVFEPNDYNNPGVFAVFPFYTAMLYDIIINSFENYMKKNKLVFKKNDNYPIVNQEFKHVFTVNIYSKTTDNFISYIDNKAKSVSWNFCIIKNRIYNGTTN